MKTDKQGIMRVDITKWGPVREIRRALKENVYDAPPTSHIGAAIDELHDLIGKLDSLTHYSRYSLGDILDKLIDAKSNITAFESELKTAAGIKRSGNRYWVYNIREEDWHEIFYRKERTFDN